MMTSIDRIYRIADYAAEAERHLDDAIEIDLRLPDEPTDADAAAFLPKYGAYCRQRDTPSERVVRNWRVLRDRGLTFDEIAELWGWDQATVFRALAS